MGVCELGMFSDDDEGSVPSAARQMLARAVLVAAGDVPCAGNVGPSSSKVARKNFCNLLNKCTQRQNTTQRVEEERRERHRHRYDHM